MADPLVDGSPVSTTETVNSVQLTQVMGKLLESGGSSNELLAQIAAAITASIIGGSTGGTDNRILRAKGTTGRALDAGPLTLSDAGNISGFPDATGLLDDSGNEQLIFQKTNTAVNQWEMLNSATANPATQTLTAAGDDTNIHANIVSKGTGVVQANGIPILTSIALQAFTTPGANTYTPTAGMKFAFAISTGGGGGGGGVDVGAAESAGGSGGGGAATCIELFLAATIGANQTVTIGAAGTAGANTGGNGGNGGDTTFGALHTAGGGVGGLGSTTDTGHTTGANGGTATGGLLNIPGGRGGDGAGQSSTSIQAGGLGGSSLWGSGSQALANASAPTSAGPAGTAYGTGGGGAVVHEDGTGTAGGAGASGACIVLEFI